MNAHHPRLAHPSGPVAKAPAEDYIRRPGKIRLLHTLGRLIPGDYLKTAFYLNCIDAPRRFLRDAL